MLSLIAPFLAESRALLVIYKGQLYFPTFQYLSMGTFGQMPPPGWATGDIETEYLRLQREWQAERVLFDREPRWRRDDAQKTAAAEAKYPNRGNFVIMPPIPWDPYQSDFWYNEILNEIQVLLTAGDREGAERIARRDRLNELADLIYSGEIDAVLADRMRSPTGNLIGLARGGTMPSLAGLAVVPPNPPDSLRRHYLGTDSQGRDVASRLLYGFRISIFFALFLVFIGQVIGTLIGSLQGYLGGRFDILSQRFIEILVSIPFLYVVIILAALLTPSFWLLVAIMVDFPVDQHHVLYADGDVSREDARILPGGEIVWRVALAHHLPPSAAQLSDAAGDVHAVRHGGRDLCADRTRLSRLRTAGADAELGPVARSGAAAGKSRQTLADAGAVLAPSRSRWSWSCSSANRCARRSIPSSTRNMNERSEVLT